MSCLFTRRRFKKARRMLVNQLKELLESPTKYLKTIEELQALYYSFFDDTKTKLDCDRVLAGYLVHKGLLSPNEVNDEIDRIQQIKEDNVFVVELKDMLVEMNKRIDDLEQYTIINTDEMKKIRNTIQKKIRTLQTINQSKPKKQRSQVQIT